eukprot:168486_1
MMLVVMLYFAVISTYSQMNKQYNILFVAFDDLRPELGGVYGQNDIIYTPNLEAFMDRSFTFTHAYTQCAICAATRTSFLTGTRPDTSRIWTIGPYFRETMVNGKGPSSLTIPQYFKNNGYWTVGAGKIFHPGSASGGNGTCENLQGNDAPYSWSEPYWDCGYGDNGKESSPVMHDCPASNEYLPGCVQDGQCQECLSSHNCFSNSSSFKRAYCPADCSYSCYPDGAIATQTLNYFKRYTTDSNLKNKPFFIATGFAKPHLGFYAPRYYYNLYPAQSTKLANPNRPPINMPPIATNNCSEISNYNDVGPNITTMDYKWIGSNKTYKIALITDEYSHYLRAAYYAAASFADSQFGRVIQGLYEYNLWNNTIVVVTGDHGWSLGEQGTWTKHTNFEMSTRVPLLFRMPGINEGKYSDVLVEQLDMFPTLLDLAGIPFDKNVTNQLEGKSLKDIIFNPEKPPNFPQYAYSQYIRGGNSKMGLSIRTTQWRYTEWLTWNAGNNKTGSNAVYPHPNWNDVLGIELYNHSNNTVDENDFNAQDNYNFAYEKNMSSTVKQLHDILVQTWDNQTWGIAYDNIGTV